MDGGSSTHVYPRTTDPAYCGAKVTAVNSSTEFVINAGVSTVPTFYQSGGVAQPALIAPRASNHSASGSDPAAVKTGVLRVIDNTTFEINTGISTREHFYARCGSVKKPIDIVFDNPVSYSGIGLTYASGSAGIGSATIDIVVGQGSSVIDFEIRNTGYGYGNGETLTVLSEERQEFLPHLRSPPSNQFEIEIENVINDEFTGWSLGVIETFDDVSNYIDGTRIDFPLLNLVFQYPSISPRDLRLNLINYLIVLVNGILQVPGISYEFNGGSQITFTEH